MNDALVKNVMIYFWSSLGGDSDESIQTDISDLDCFASLAMTKSLTEFQNISL
jgi:hypothetical protein